MPKKSASKKKTAAPAALSDLPTFRAGMPALDSIIGVRPLTPPAAPGAPGAPAAAAAPTSAYRIITTNEVDAYDAGATPHEVLAAGPAAPAPAGDDFAGTARKAAKLSIANAPTGKFKDLKNQIKSLTADSAMIAHVPKIKSTATSGRVKEEKRNVSLKVFLYAASREADNDFHLILGRDPKATPEIYMTMELSGLPPASSASFAKLNTTREAFKAFFGTNLPGITYDFYDPPIPVDIEGSLFFDMTHATGQHPGPKSLKSRIPTIWEVHPITKITFKP